MEQQIEHHRKMAAHLRSEIALYRQLEAREVAEQERILASAIDKSKNLTGTEAGKQIAQESRAASAAIDEELALSLTLYSEDAKVYGFAFEAHRLETQALPQLLEMEAQNKRGLDQFNEAWGQALATSKYQVNKWAKKAEQVNMRSEYDFIYSYTSRLLHGTPASISTHQQILEEGEFLLFYKYIHAEFVWILRRAQEGRTSTTSH